MRPLRFGLVGTGHWARVTHAPALASTDGIEFGGVWGRNPEAAASLAAEYTVTVHRDLDDLIADVDGLAFSVPPDVQSAIAVRAAEAGKHLLLEKPIATSEAQADAVVRAVDHAQVATVVFFTARFQADVRSWLASVAGQDRWMGGIGVWLGSALRASSPFNTPWRQVKGALWDLAPHALSLLWAGLGPVVAVTADAGPADVTHMVLHHANGASSTVTVTLSASDAAEGFDLYLWGESGRSPAPYETDQPVDALRIALSELADNARSGQTAHPCDVHFGHEIGRVLAEAQRQLDERSRS